MATETERLAVLIEANTKSYERAMARMEQRTNQAMRRSTRSVSQLDNRMKGLAIGAGRALAAFGIGAGVVGFAAVARSIGDAVKEADKLAKTADKVGLTTGELQEMRYAAELTGVAVGQADVAMQRFSRRIAEAAAGGGVLAPVLEANNIALRDQDGRLRSNRDLLGEYADLVKNAASEQDALRLAFLAFDTEGAALVNTLRNGKQGLADFADEAHRVGAVLDEELIRRAEDVADDWQRFTTSLTTSWQEFVLSVVNGVVDARNAIASLPENFERSKNFSDAETLASLKQLLARRPDHPDREAILQGIADFEARGIGSIGVRTGGQSYDVIDPRNPKKETRIPGTGAGGGGGTSTADKIEKTIDALTREREQLTRTSREQAIYNALARAGIDENHERAEAVMDAAGAFHDEELSIGRLTEAMDSLRDVADNALTSFLSDLRRGKTAGEAMTGVLDDLVDRLASAQIDRFLNSILGAPGVTGGGVAAQVAATVFGGYRAEGGPVSAGRSYVVGEKGPELYTPALNGHVTPNGAGGSNVTVNVLTEPGAPVQQNRRQVGGREVVDVIVGMVADDVRNGGQINRAMRSSFGLTPSLTER